MTTQAEGLLRQVLKHLKVVKGPDAKGWYTAWCVSHPDGQGKPPHQPNLKLNERGYSCMACQVKGSLRKLAKELGIDVSSPPETNTRLPHLSDSDAMKKLKDDRLLRDDTIEHFAIAPDKAAQAWKYSAPSGHHRFKAYDSGHDPKYWHDKGTPNQLYGLSDIPSATKEVWWVNGEPAVWVAYQAGLPAVCGLYGEGKVPPGARAQLRDKGIETVYIPPDLDLAGRQAAFTIQEELKTSGLKVVARQLPDYLGGKADLCDLYKWHAGDNGAFLEALASLPQGKLMPGGAFASAPRLLLVDLGELEVREVGWLWPRWIPKGFVSLLTGDPDAGKTYVALDLAATVAEGAKLPDGAISSPGRVLYIDGENGLDEIKRRLVARSFTQWQSIRIVSEVVVGEGHQELDIDRHMDALHEALMTFKPAWVIIDPLVAFHERNEIIATQVRALLRLLFGLAQKYECAITVVQHPNKTFLAPELYRVRGSLDFVAAVRAMLRVEVLKDRDDEGRALVVEKLNLCAKPPPLGFTIDKRGVKWIGEVNLGKPESALAEASQWLKDILAGGPQASSYVEEAAKAEGLSWATVRRAKQKLGVKAQKIGQKGWVWALPGTLLKLEDAEPPKDERLEHLPYKPPDKMSTFPMPKGRCSSTSPVQREGTQDAQDAHGTGRADDEHLPPVAGVATSTAEGGLDEEEGRV